MLKVLSIKTEWNKVWPPRFKQHGQVSLNSIFQCHSDVLEITWFWAQKNKAYKKSKKPQQQKKVRMEQYLVSRSEV